MSRLVAIGLMGAVLATSATAARAQTNGCPLAGLAGLGFGWRF